MIPRARPNYRLRDLVGALRHGRDSGPLCAEVEALLAGFLGGGEAGWEVAAAPSGRGALYAILRALPQPAVVLPAYTCTAVTEAALLAGKRVRYAPHEPGAVNATAEAMAALAGPETVVVATHQFGMPMDVATLVGLCAERGAPVVEDIAAALGTRIGGRMAGSFGLASFGSFDTTKLVHAPLKGGFVATRDAALLARIHAVMAAEFAVMPRALKLRWLALAAALVAVTAHGLPYRLFHRLNFGLRGRATEESGVPAARPTDFYRWRLAEWQAAVALPQLRRLPALVARRQALHARLLAALEGLSAVELPPPDREGAWACVRFPLMARSDKFAYYGRAAMAGIDMGFSYTFIPEAADRDEAAKLARAVLNLPFYDRLRDDEIAAIATGLRRLDAARD